MSRAKPSVHRQPKPAAPFKRKRRRRLVRPEEMSLSELYYLLFKLVVVIVVVLGLDFFIFNGWSAQLLLTLVFAASMVVIYWHSRARSVATFLGVSKLTRIRWGHALFFLTLGFFLGELAEYRLHGFLVFANPRWLIMGPLAATMPVPEEIMLRGWIYPAMRAHWSLEKSMCVMTIIVLLTHSNAWHNPFNAAFIIGMHLILSYLRERFHSITPGILAHSVYNGIVYLG